MTTESNAQNYASVRNIAMSEYMRIVISLLNKEMARRENYKSLQAASLEVRKDSLDINRDFSDIEYDHQCG